ncbi:hypothetical protein AB833_07060 [Chromatiales bacterium (ex Bugula neritina AB1)]|nr:hypothetical protein AB833_07060 [Chromatiales bacterium (ex Bugula neritina AB1)]
MIRCSRIDKRWHQRADIELSILHLERHTELAAGNKQYKLQGNLRYWHDSGAKRILTFGGAWSNHLHAFAYQANINNLQAVGVVRGEEMVSNSLLRAAQSFGMHLYYISRSEYRNRRDKIYCRELCEKLGCDFWLPEGASNSLAVAGCTDITSSIPLPDKCRIWNGKVDTVFALAVGTGATLAGVASSLHANQSVVGFPVVNDSSVSSRIGYWVERHTSDNKQKNWMLWPEPNLLSYGKLDTGLLEFIIDFFSDTGIALDPVYTGRVMQRLLKSDFLDSLRPGTKLIYIHTGGLIGAWGYRKQFTACCDRKTVANYFSEIQRLTGHTGE